MMTITMRFIIMVTTTIIIIKKKSQSWLKEYILDPYYSADENDENKCYYQMIVMMNME